MLFRIVKKLPKLFLLTIVFITIILLGFLLIGCMDEKATFSNTYLMKVQFNESSNLYPNIQAAYNSLNHSSELSKMLIKASYLAMCVDLSGLLTCEATTDLTSLSKYSGVSIVETTSSSTTSQIDLVNVATSFSDSCHPRVLVATILLTVILELCLIWSSISFLPGKFWTRKICCFLLACSLLVWGLGAMLQHEAILNTKNIIKSASMNTMEVKIGKSAEAITWTSFTFLLITCMGNILIYVRESIIVKKQEPVSSKL